jgi:mono/diheme cytochrome c family protein
METKKIHSVAGLFESPDAIIAAAEKVNAKGYKFYDINTPYPVHGMDKAMKLKPSMMGYFALAFGLTGTTFALILLAFTAFDYPLNIGGKPSFALPAFIPITFELTVLFAAIGTVVGLLFVFFKMPDNNNPLHDTNYMKQCTSSLYGVCIEAKDALFNETETTQFLREIGATDIETIYYNEEEVPPIFTKQFVMFLCVAAVVIAGATFTITNKLMFIQPFNWMMDHSRLDAQENFPMFSDGNGMREPVSGTVPKNFMPEEYKNSPDSAGKFLINPLEASQANIDLGKKKFLTYCSPCHGNYAKGDSRLRGLFPNPPTLHSKKVRTWPDGRIYHVITYGQNSMPSYAKQVTRDERWAVILYLRSLQRAFNPKEEDFNEPK